MERSSASMWRKINSRYNLVGNVCENCGTGYFPPRIVCRNCGRKSKMVTKKFSGNGTIFSFTNIRVPPETFREEAPYAIGLIKLDEGPMVEGHLIDNGIEAKIGGRAKLAFRKMYTQGEEGLIHYQYKFEPV